MINGIIGGAIGGAIGAALWAGITYGTGYEIGWIAWGIGALVGVGHAAGFKEGGTVAGASAVVIAVAALLGGKYASIELMLSQELGDWAAIGQEALADDDEAVVAYIADQIIVDRLDSGEPVDWPNDAGFDEFIDTEDYPADVWQQATAVWESMSPSGQQEFRQLAVQSVESSLNEFRDMIAAEGFIHSFGILDVVFFGLAIAAAYKIASEGSADNSEQMVPDQPIPDGDIA